MYDVSDRFLAAVRRSHRAVNLVALMEGDEVVDYLPIGTGSVEVESGAKIRRRVSFTIVNADGTWTPSVEGPIAPYGTEVIPWSGIDFGDGTSELVPQGRFTLTSVVPSQRGQVITVKGFDLSFNADRPLPKAVPIPGLTPWNDGAARLVRAAYPSADFDDVADIEGTSGPLLYQAGANALESAQKLARSGGLGLYPDRLGRFILPPLPSSLGGGEVPVGVIRDGEDGVLLPGAEETFSSEEHPYNGVIVYGAAVRGAPIVVALWDEDPFSPTYRYGPYGENPEVITDEKITTEGAALRRARARLQTHLGKGQEVSGDMLVNPAYDADDLVAYSMGGAAPRGFYIHSLTIPLTVKGAMSFTLRRGIFGDSEITPEEPDE